ncbi:MAG: hypothetical protein ACREEH_08690, partial [Caulobacteraceae bacterium]
LASRPEIAERIAGELMRQGTVPAYKEARAALVEARRINAEMAADFDRDRQDPVKSETCGPILRLPFTPKTAHRDLTEAN